MGGWRAMTCRARNDTAGGWVSYTRVLDPNLGRGQDIRKTMVAWRYRLVVAGALVMHSCVHVFEPVSSSLSVHGSHIVDCRSCVSRYSSAVARYNQAGHQDQDSRAEVKS